MQICAQADLDQLETSMIKTLGKLMHAISIHSGTKELVPV